jgi:multimeric flavodoxin WrbA
MARYIVFAEENSHDPETDMVQVRDGEFIGDQDNHYTRRHEMKVVAFNGSSRKDGNTAILVKEVFKELKKAGIRTEMVQLAGKKISGCIACGKCFSNRDRRCVVNGDMLNECIEKMLEADGIILASPTYFADISANMKALIERAGFVARANDDMFRRKAGAAVIAVRRCGAIHAFDSINHFFFISQMVVPGSSYWNVGIGLAPGDVKGDKEGLATMKTLGANMAWLLDKINR